MYLYIVYLNPKGTWTPQVNSLGVNLLEWCLQFRPLNLISTFQTGIEEYQHTRCINVCIPGFSLEVFFWVQISLGNTDS